MKLVFAGGLLSILSCEGLEQKPNLAMESLDQSAPVSRNGEVRLKCVYKNTGKEPAGVTKNKVEWRYSKSYSSNPNDYVTYHSQVVNSKQLNVDEYQQDYPIIDYRQPGYYCLIINLNFDRDIKETDYSDNQMHFIIGLR